MNAGPTCRHFGRCGGCSLLDVAPARQLADKLARARGLLQPFLGDVPLTVAAPRAPGPYRTRLLYPVQPDEDGVLCAGLYATGSHEVVEIEECAIQAPALTALAQRFVAILRARGASPYDERRRRGWLRAVHARIAAGSNELIAGLVTTDDSFPLRATLVPQLVDACRDLPGWEPGAPPPHLVGLVQNVHREPGNYLLGPTTQALFGRDHLLDVHDNLTFRIGFTSFYQVHRAAAALLYQPALALLGDVAGLRVVDGYGGVGAFALRLGAAGVARVELVEVGPSACADAVAAAAMNGLSERVAVVRAPFADADLAPRPDLVVLDPPRAGLLPGGVAKLLALAPARVLYASCSAASLARDLGELGDDYAVTAARLCDLFPHTPHDEVVVLLERR